MKIAIDIMSGDLPSSSTLNGAVNYLNTHIDDILYLVGKESFFKKNKRILNKIKNHNYELIYAEDDILDTDSVTRLFKKRPESPLIKSIQLLKDNTVDATVSSGNTGALLSSSLMILGKIERIKRPALAAFIPTDKGGFVLCDVGANSNNKPIHLLQFSLMASAYIKYLEKE